MPEPFQHIGVICKQGDPKVASTVAKLVRFLTEERRRVLIDVCNAAELPPGTSLEMVSREQLGETCDLVIVVGGDGTLLNAARTLADHGVPLVGINLGRLGFLADVSPDEMLEMLKQILGGAYQEQSRFLLHAEILRNGETIARNDAFNDVVLHKWDPARMIEFETYVNGQFVYSQRSDGLIVSTPTGSTAYALSGGGPILHPTLEAVVLVPICPHTLTNRPIALTSDSHIEIQLGDGGESHAQLTCDGQLIFQMHGGDRVSIRKKTSRITLIQPPGHDYYGILRAKLHWGRKVS